MTFIAQVPQALLCPFCRKPNAGRAKFCRDCGSKIKVVKLFCSKCGTKLREEAKFCNQCGTKQLTIR